MHSPKTHRSPFPHQNLDYPSHQAQEPLSLLSLECPVKTVKYRVLISISFSGSTAICTSKSTPFSKSTQVNGLTYSTEPLVSNASKR
ncbi:hypothetical protein EYC80_005278 [Monilinia laxa]|uniref:Uncharacterized protein n=1 Tax=Monilinia laxa TaxID=61186 RepID=A0A5N6KJQ1_MONLA|nr:hypothetical protein EYC80_005278 [Monilinia laxa]